MVCCTRATASSLAFLQHFYDLITSVHNKNKTYHFVRVNKEVKEDVKVWLNLLEHFNGVVLIPEQCWISNEAIIDSSGNNQLGFGAYYFGHWGSIYIAKFMGNSPMLRDLTVLELIPVLLAQFIWAHLFENKKLTFRNGNIALVAITNKITSKSKTSHGAYKTCCCLNNET